MGLSTLLAKSTSPQLPSHAFPFRFMALIWGTLAQEIPFRCTPNMDASPSTSVGSDLTLDAQELPGRVNLAFPSDLAKLTSPMPQVQNPRQMLREPSRVE